MITDPIQTEADIAELKERLKEALKRIEELEKRPQYVPFPYPVQPPPINPLPEPWPYQPWPQPYTTPTYPYPVQPTFTCCSPFR